MAQSLIGQLLIYLGINTAGYEGGLSKSMLATRRFAGEVKEQFLEVGRGISTLVGSMGGISPAFAAVAGSIVSGLGMVAKSFTVAADSALAFRVVTLSVIGVLGAAVAGLAAVGIHAANNARELARLSEATNVSISALSGWGPLANSLGLSTDQLARGLERMDRSLTVAIEQGDKGNNVYKRLGFTLAEMEQMARNPTAAITMLADKFDHLRTGAEKTAAAIQIFGRAGADLLPFLNLGVANLRDFITYAEKVGAVLNDNTKQSLLAFSLEMAKLKLGFQGLEFGLMQGMLPAMQQLTAAFANLADGGDLWVRIGKLVGDTIVAIAETFMVLKTVVFSVVLVFKAVVHAIEDTVLSIYHLGAAIVDISSGDIPNAFNHLKLMSEDWKNDTGADIKAIGGQWKELAQFIKDVNADPKPLPKPKGDQKFDTGASEQQLDFIKQIISELQRQADKEEELAKAVGKYQENSILAEAAAKRREVAEKLVDEAIAKGISLKDFEKGLREAAAELDHGSAAAQKYMDAINRLGGILDTAAARFAFFKASVDLTNQIDSSTRKLDELKRALEDEAEAGTKVGREQAKIGLVYQTSVNDLQHMKDALSTLASQAGLTSDQIVQMMNAIDRNADALANMKPKVDAAKDAVSGIVAGIELNKLDKQFTGLQEKLSSLSDSDAFLNIDLQVQILKNDVGLAAKDLGPLVEKMKQIRDVQIQLATAKIVSQFGFSPGEVETLRIELSQLSKDLHNLWDKSTPEARAYLFAIQDIVAKMEDLKLGVPGAMKEAEAALKKVGFEPDQLQRIVGAMTALKDPVVLEHLHDLGVTEQQIHEANLQLIADYEDMQAHGGGAVAGLKAGFADLAAQVETTGAMIRKVMDSAFKGIEDNLAKMIVTGKANWKQFLEGLEEEMLKSQIHMGLQKIAASIADKFNIPSLRNLFPGQLGSKDNPMYVIPVEGVLSHLPLQPPGEATGVPSVNKGVMDEVLSRVFGPFKASSANANTVMGTTANPMHVVVDNQGGGQGGSSLLSGLFGGSASGESPITSAVSSLPLAGPGDALSGLAGIADVLPAFEDGGDVSADQPVIVGEKRPEIFVPKSAGKIIPQVDPDVLAGLKLGGPPKSVADTIAGKKSGHSEEALNGIALASMLAAQAFKGHGLASKLLSGAATGLMGFLSVKNMFGKFQQDGLKGMLGFGGEGREFGGPVMPGQAYLTGEKRPEIFMPDSMRSVNSTDSHDTYGGNTVHYNFGPGSDYDSFRRNESQLAAHQATMAQVGKQRNG